MKFIMAATAHPLDGQPMLRGISQVVMADYPALIAASGTFGRLINLSITERVIEVLMGQSFRSICGVMAIFLRPFRRVATSARSLFASRIESLVLGAAIRCASAFYALSAAFIHSEFVRVEHLCGFLNVALAAPLKHDVQYTTGVTD